MIFHSFIGRMPKIPAREIEPFSLFMLPGAMVVHWTINPLLFSGETGRKNRNLSFFFRLSSSSKREQMHSRRTVL